MPRFGGYQLSSGSVQLLYTAPASKKSTVSLNVVNTGADSALINVAFCASGTLPTIADYIEYNTSIPPGATLERTGITPENGERLYGISNQANVIMVVWGFEEEDFA